MRKPWCSSFVILSFFKINEFVKFNDYHFGYYHTFPHILKATYFWCQYFTVQLFLKYYVIFTFTYHIQCLAVKRDVDLLTLTEERDKAQSVKCDLKEQVCLSVKLSFFPYLGICVVFVCASYCLLLVSV